VGRCAEELRHTEVAVVGTAARSTWLALDAAQRRENVGSAAMADLLATG